MVHSVPLDVAQTKLKQLVLGLLPGDEIVLTEEDRPVAKLVYQTASQTRPKPGLGRGSILYISEDFDAPLDEMREYMR